MPVFQTKKKCENNIVICFNFYVVWFISKTNNILMFCGYDNCLFNESNYFLLCGILLIAQNKNLSFRYIWHYICNALILLYFWDFTLCKMRRTIKIYRLWILLCKTHFWKKKYQVIDFFSITIYYIFLLVFMRYEKKLSKEDIFQYNVYYLY